jgi:predicted nuclease of restriction endonuclease-like RecB superfamily
MHCERYNTSSETTVRHAWAATARVRGVLPEANLGAHSAVLRLEVSLMATRIFNPEAGYHQRRIDGFSSIFKSSQNYGSLLTSAHVFRQIPSGLGTVFYPVA